MMTSPMTASQLLNHTFEFSYRAKAYLLDNKLVNTGTSNVSTALNILLTFVPSSIIAASSMMTF